MCHKKDKCIGIMDGIKRLQGYAKLTLERYRIHMWIDSQRLNAVRLELAIDVDSTGVTRIRAISLEGHAE